MSEASSIDKDARLTAREAIAKALAAPEITTTWYLVSYKSGGRPRKGQVAVTCVRNSSWSVRLPHLYSILFSPVGMTRAAKGTLIVSCIISSLIIWGVHHQQTEEREVRSLLPNSTAVLNLAKTMYQGVLRDDERRREKMKKREEDLQESLRKREEYERVQSVTAASQRKSV